MKPASNHLSLMRTASYHSLCLRPQADNLKLDIQAIKAEVERLQNKFEPVPHERLLDRLLEHVERIDFRQLADLDDSSDKLAKKHYLVACVEQVLSIARRNSWGLCQHNGSVYLYNGAFWCAVDDSELQVFLGRAAEKMGVDKFDARHYSFQEQLYKQFLAAANLPKPKQRLGVVLVNLLNGTLEIRPEGHVLRAPRPQDFLTYQLPFAYDPKAEAPMFRNYLNQVQPDPDRQKILAEYIGSVFVPSGMLKLEKALLLYGSGANGKSVFFEVINSMLGTSNVSNFSLQSLTDSSGYYRAKIGDKLLNYASEISGGRMQLDLFKQLVSGEPVEARLPYKDPFTITNYAKFIFNCNELPKDVEHNNAFFRRLLIVPFEVTVPEEGQDKELARKITEQELSGVLNWVLAGLGRLMEQKGFTYSEAVERQLLQYKQGSDSVLLFLEDEGYKADMVSSMPFKALYSEYRVYCVESGYKSCSRKTFSARLTAAGYQMERKNYGQAVYIRKSS
ncbi:DNA primase family protein [Pontibacter kalidii]|uniref:DNA primase family protein n=1 Tax=Pontibacter kalidii TaxID=2592049 RepID=UPI0022538D44|nr:phage/plasmid primase, P4 family [Pontibacter kalidii]